MLAHVDSSSHPQSLQIISVSQGQLSSHWHCDSQVQLSSHWHCDSQVQLSSHWHCDSQVQLFSHWHCVSQVHVSTLQVQIFSTQVHPSVTQSQAPGDDAAGSMKHTAMRLPDGREYIWMFCP